MSNDLISRSALLQALKGNVLVDVTSNLENAIAEQPTAYDLDKVVKLIQHSVYRFPVFCLIHVYLRPSQSPTLQAHRNSHILYCLYHPISGNYDTNHRYHCGHTLPGPSH